MTDGNAVLAAGRDFAHRIHEGNAADYDVCSRLNIQPRVRNRPVRRSIRELIGVRHPACIALQVHDAVFHGVPAMMASAILTGVTPPMAPRPRWSRRSR